MKKKAMSPLFSTILLIGFAIALGGIVMSWGQSSIENSPRQCSSTSITAVSYAGNNGACVSGNLIKTTLQNNGEVPLSGVKVLVIGDSDIYENTIQTELGVAQAARLEMQYNSVGKIEKLIFVPVYKDLSKDKLCPQNEYSIEGIGEC